MKLNRDDVDRICRFVVDYDFDTQDVPDRFDPNRRRVQQLAKEYRECGELLAIETPGRKPYAKNPNALVESVLDHSDIY